MLPAKFERELGTLIKFIEFKEHRVFLTSTIRCHINPCRGRYVVEDNYREVVLRHTMAESDQDFSMTRNEQLELFVLFVLFVMTFDVMDFLFFFELFKLTLI